MTFRWTCAEPGSWEGTGGAYRSSIRRIKGDLFVSVRIADTHGAREVSFYVFDDILEAMQWAEIAALEDRSRLLEEALDI